MNYPARLRENFASLRTNVIDLANEARRHPRATIAAALGATAVVVGTHIADRAIDNLPHTPAETCLVTSPVFNLKANSNVDSLVANALHATKNGNGQIVGFDVAVASAGGQNNDAQAEWKAAAIMDELNVHEGATDIDGTRLSTIDVVAATGDFSAGSVRVDVVTDATSCNVPNAEYLV